MPKKHEIMMERGYISANEVARRVGVNKATVYRMIHSGRVGVLRHGAMFFVDARQLAEQYQDVPPIYDSILAGIPPRDPHE
jgi:excisionase family DNA binding protein